MARKKVKVNLAPGVQPRGGDLDRLFMTANDAEQAAGLQLLAIRIDAIEPDPDQPRTSYNEEALLELAASIRQDGVIQPIEVTQLDSGRYLIVHGERRWRAAQLAGLDTMPAVVRRRDYDEVTRFVRQVVENIQREDLNDVDRAAALLRLRQLMQEELDAALAGEREPDDDPGQAIAAAGPWSGKVTWAKVGQRLGYSRQRIHQLIQLLDLPDEIKDAVRDGLLSERDTRVYQGLTQVQQRALHRGRMSGDLTSGDLKQIARLLKEAPDLSVSQAERLLRHRDEEEPVSIFTAATARTAAPKPARVSNEDEDGELSGRYSFATGSSGSVIPARTGRPSNIERLDWVRGHLARIDRVGLTTSERKELIRLLTLIREDVTDLTAALVQAADYDTGP